MNDRYVETVNDTETGGYEERRTVRRPPWSVTQLVVLVIGLVFVVVGGVALARTGFHYTAVPSTHTEVAGLGFSSLSATLTVAVGIILACGSTRPMTARSVGWVMGVALLAFGLIVGLSPNAFFNMWGFSSADGVAIAICGAVLLLAAAIFPVVNGAMSSYRRERGHPVVG